MADLYLDEEDEEAVHGEETHRMEGVSEPVRDDFHVF